MAFICKGAFGSQFTAFRGLKLASIELDSLHNQHPALLTVPLLLVGMIQHSGLINNTYPGLPQYVGDNASLVHIYVIF